MGDNAARGAPRCRQITTCGRRTPRSRRTWALARHRRLVPPRRGRQRYRRLLSW